MAKTPRRHMIAPVPPPPISPEPPPALQALAVETPAQQLQINPTGRRTKKRSDLSTCLLVQNFSSEKKKMY